MMLVSLGPMAKKLFIAATGQHKGKTTSTLGIAATLKKRGFKVGYCKPVGQNHIIIGDAMVDKDVVLFENILNFKTVPHLHSPVIISSGVTSEFLENPDQFTFEAQIQTAQKYLESHHDIIVFEGTGHAGVGSIVNLSNAQVAKLLGCEVIIVVEGGIGSAFDQLNMNLALFREIEVPVKGVIINKVLPEKSKKIERCLTQILTPLNIPILGLLPYDSVLSYPLVATIKNAVEGRVILNEHKLYNRVEDIIAGSLAAIDDLNFFRNLMLIVNIDNLKKKIQKIKNKSEKEKFECSPLSGVIITSYTKFKTSPSMEHVNDPYLIENEIPLLVTELDTYDTVHAISHLEVKINRRTPWKVARAISLFEENIDIQKILE